MSKEQILEEFVQLFFIKNGELSVETFCDAEAFLEKAIDQTRNDCTEKIIKALENLFIHNIRHIQHIQLINNKK